MFPFLTTLGQSRFDFTSSCSGNSASLVHGVVGGRDSHGESEEEATQGGASATPCVIGGGGTALWGLCRR